MDCSLDVLFYFYFLIIYCKASSESWARVYVRVHVYFGNVQP